MIKTQFKSLIFLLIVLCFMNNNSALAHAGGHYHQGDILNTWSLANGQQIRGNFSRIEGNQMILEQTEGRLIAVPIQDLSAQDQKLAHINIEKYLEINNPRVSNIEIQSNQIVYQSLNLLFWFLISLLIILLMSHLVFNFKSKFNRKPAFLVLSSLCLFAFIGMVACKKNSSTTTTPIATISKTSTSFLDAAFEAYKPAVATSWDNTYFYVASNGLPAHNMMVGITSWQQQVPAPQFYTGTNKWSIPLQPVYAASPLSTTTNFMKGAVAIAVNGVPIFNALNNRGEDAYLIGELDQWGGHCGKGDDYHYHAAPLHLSTTSGLKPIAFALDGFSVYGAKEPDGATMATLDACHGHIYNGGVYHYHGTTNYPYVIGSMKGVVATDPSTPAPENQILPQAFSSPFRPATSPLSGASITAFASSGTNSYLLTYKIGTKNGYVNYAWDSANKYTFTFTSPDGVVTTSTYQR